MKYVLLLCLLGLVAARNPLFTESYESVGLSSFDETKIIDTFNQVFDKLYEQAENGRHFTIQTITELFKVVRVMKEKGMNFVDLLKQRVSRFSGNFKKALISYFEIFGIHIGGETQAADIKQIDQDEAVKLLIDRLNKVVDKVIEALQNRQLRLFPGLISDIIDVINKLREHHIKWINIISQRVQHIRGDIRERINNFINFIKRIINDDDEQPVHESSAVEVDEVIAKKEELKKQFLDKLDGIIEKLKEGRFPGAFTLADCLRIAREGIRLGMDMEKMALERVQLMGGQVHDLIKGILDWVFKWAK